MRAFGATRTWAGAIGILAAVLGLMAMPPGAAAKQGFDVHERSLQLILAIKGSNGFRGLITTKGHKQVTMTVVKGDRSIELRTSGQVSRRGISARFGDLAEVAVRFQSESGSTNPRLRQRGDSTPRCSGRDPVLERGVFRGTIHFRGENDFARVDAKRAPGGVERHFRRVCKRPQGGTLSSVFKELFGSLRITLLEARARVGSTNVVFEAASFDLSSIFGPGAPPSYGFTGRTVERDDGARIVRAAEAEGGDGTLLAGKPGKTPRIVTVVPPKPFLKTATRTKEAGVPATWVGPLAARLLGGGLVALAGPEFKSAVCNLTLAEIIAGDRCLPRRGELGSSSLAALGKAAAQGSGSQSQAFWDARLSWSR